MKSHLALAAALLLPLSAGAAVIAEYNAALGADPQNPTAQGWSESIGSGSPSPVGAGSETLDGTTWRYWSISNSASAFSTTYRINLDSSAFTDPQGWTATARLRVTSAHEGLTSNYLQVRDGSSQWQVILTRDTETSRISYWGVDTDPNQRLKLLANYDLASDYLTVQFHYDPGTDQVRVYVNGAQIGAALSRADVPEVSQLFINFGDGDNSPRATRTNANWNQVIFETGNTVIPEAGTSALVLGGIGVLAAWAKNRRRP